MKAMPGKVIVQVDEIPERTAGGLYVPDNARDDSSVGVVIDANLDGEDTPVQLAAGAHVLIGRYAGVKAIYDGKPYVIFNVNEILAVLEAAPAVIQ